MKLSAIEQVKKYLEFMSSERAMHLMPVAQEDMSAYPEVAFSLGCQEGYKRCLMYLEESLAVNQYKKSK